jgi:hypothetical protein
MDNLRGAVAQLGERLNGIQEAVGSIPSSSTMNSMYQRQVAEVVPDLPFYFF